MIRHGVLFAGVLLAGCGAPDAPPEANAVNAAAAPDLPAPAADNAIPPFAEMGNAHPTAPEPAPVPAAFRGIWAESEALCGDRSHPSRLVVSGATLRFHESVMTVADARETGPRAVNLIGSAQGEGTTRPAEYHFSIDAAGRTLTDEAGGGMVRVRCG